MNRAGTVTGWSAGTPTRVLRAPGWLLFVALSALSAAVAAPNALAAPGDAVLDAVAAPPESEARPAPRGDSRGRLRDVAEWVELKQEKGISALPAEARIFYRRGLLAHESGEVAEAIADLRGASELDPSFVQPHVTLAIWSALADPAQSLVHWAAVVERLRRDFNLQLDLAANALTLGYEAVFAGLLLVGLLILLLRTNELSHGFEEQLRVHVSPMSARVWVLALLLVPFLAGFGLTLPVLLLLGFLWEPLRVRERALFVLLAAAAVFAPLAFGALDRFALALRTDGPPFYELPLLEHAPWRAEHQKRVEAYAEQDPDNGFAQFALGWYSRRDGRLAQAETAYEAALEAWPENSVVLTDLGNVAAMRGHTDRALELYRRATKSDSGNAAAHFNAAQLLTRRFEYNEAQNELRAASALDFELVKRYQARAGAAGMLPLADLWPEPHLFWTALLATPAPRSLPLPLSLRGWRESAGGPFSFAALVAIAAGVLLGRWQHRRFGIRYCNNCGAVVCRRCARRRRERALCHDCDRVGAGAETQEFSRVLLNEHSARRRTVLRYLRAGLAALVPGFGLVSLHRVFGPTLLLACAWLLGRLALGHVAPFSVTPRLALPGGVVPGAVLGVALASLYLWSLAGYFLAARHERRRDADLAARNRPTPSSRREPSMAA